MVMRRGLLEPVYSLMIHGQVQSAGISEAVPIASQEPSESMRAQVAYRRKYVPRGICE